MDIGIFYHGTHARVLVHPRLVDSCKNHGTILWPGVHRKKVMATESPPGLPSAISITSLPICSRPPFYFIQFS